MHDHRFSTVTKARIFQMKSELQTIKKGSEPISQYLQRIKDARDHLSAAGVSFEDDDIVILALNGLPSDYNTFRCMVRGRENVLSLKDFRSQLIAEEATLEQTNSASPFVSAMMAQNQTFQGKALVLDEGISNSQPQGYPSGNLSISNIGSSILDVPPCSLQLKQVLHVPKLSRHLLSIHRLSTESLNTLLPSASECLLSTSQNMPVLESATQSPLPVDPDFQPETLCVVLPLPAVNLHPMTTRSKNGISKRKAYSASVQPVDYSQVEPSSFKAASTTSAWQSAMREEIEALHAQDTWDLELLDKVDLQDSKPCATPCLPYHRLLKDDGKPYSHPKQYRSIVGALQYLTFTRPDIAFSVNQACQFMHNPMESHVVAVKRILRYLKGTLDFGIHFQPGILNLQQAYGDA
ncbi:unnamed protein product [Prunus brigantina]